MEIIADCIRRRALLGAILATLIGALPAFCDTPRGVFCLLPAGQGDGKDPAIYSDPSVDGVSVRQKWYELEPSEGVFDFTFLDAVSSMARASGKKVLLRIGTSGGSAAKGGSTPNWVFDAINAEPLPTSQKFFTWNDNGTQRTIPVFWDPVYLAKKKALIRALGAHLANNPAIKIVAASFANASSEDWAVPHTSADVSNWLAAGYTTYKMLDAGRQIIDTTMIAFPYQYVSLAVGGNGHTGGINLDPNENYLARSAVLAARASWSGRLIVQKNTLATYIAPAPGTNTLYELLWDSAPDVGAQMLWYCYGDNGYRVNGGVAIDSSKALTKSVDVGLGYGVKFVEIYRTDITHLPAATKYAHDALMAAAPSPTPSPSPTPTPTATPKPSATPSPTATPSATPSPTPDPSGAHGDLSISVTASDASVAAGQKTSYKLVVTNTGPYNVSGASITDIFPNTLTDVTFTATQSGGASGYTASGTGNIKDTVTLPVGAFITYNVTGTVSSSAVDAISNTASINPPGDFTDVALGNNSATVTTPITSESDIRVYVNDGKTLVFAGQHDTYTVEITNMGPSDVLGAVIRDDLPNIFTNVTFTATQNGGASGFTATGTGNLNETVNLPAGSQITYKVKGDVSSLGSGSMSNRATVSVPDGVLDPNSNNNVESDTDSVGLKSDLQVTVSDATNSVTAGGKQSYTIHVRNSGPSDAIGAVVKDIFSSALTGVTFTATQDGGASGFTASGTGNISDTVKLSANSRITYKVKGVISSSASGSLSNTATVTSPNGVLDPDLSNNTATEINNVSN
jgi:uncharacterized repeat protein (TIGR01451 family)